MTPLQSSVLYAVDTKLHELTAPPFAISVPSASLEGVELVRASVIDATGYEATDRLLLDAEPR